MCRRLINIIEEMLKSFHVKMLVLSAIPELVSTWVSGLDFRPIEEDEGKQLDIINLMLFPGTSLLTKSLGDGTGINKSGGENDEHDVLGSPNGCCIPNGRGSEHFEQIGSDLLELNKEKLAIPLSKSKEECKPAAWHCSAKLAIGEL
uniref:Increased DNA methylation 1 C-terminal domain-containing protein n=1 Tax=Arundo donax TaxID=35708 RepID=A0A0A8YLN0_ARUDO